MDNNLGNIVKNATARATIYGAYVIAALVVGGIQVAFSATNAIQPDWIASAQAVIAYLAIPVGGLAAINSSIVPTQVIAPQAEVIYAETATTDEPEPFDDPEKPVG